MNRSGELGAKWRKSTFSSGQSNCVEVAMTAGSKEGSEHVIAVRDSKDSAGPNLIFTPAEWQAFTAGVQGGEFDLGEMRVRPRPAAG